MRKYALLVFKLDHKTKCLTFTYLPKININDFARFIDIKKQSPLYVLSGSNKLLVDIHDVNSVIAKVINSVNVQALGADWDKAVATKAKQAVAKKSAETRKAKPKEDVVSDAEDADNPLEDVVKGVELAKKAIKKVDKAKAPKLKGDNKHSKSASGRSISEHAYRHQHNTKLADDVYGYMQ